tara:strand:- start:9919 stop:11394 length:1476 start_codon:yes stop_codon:yes gene_type:complete
MRPLFEKIFPRISITQMQGYVIMPNSIKSASLHTLVERLKQDQVLTPDVQEGDAIEVVNVSAAPEKAYHKDHAMRFEADHSGQFLGDGGQIQPGDHLRVRTRGVGGQVSNWISMQAGGDLDQRNAQLGPKGLGITVDTEGTLRPIQRGGGVLSEPGTAFQLTNQRTGEQHHFTLNEEGRIPEGIQLKGQAGDSFQIAVSDGTNNKDFSAVMVREVEAKEITDLQDPLTARKHSLSGTRKIRYTGPLFVNGAQAGDVKQGSLGNCYFCAAASTVAHFHPEMIENMMNDNGDGTYTVTFNVEQPPNSGKREPVSVTVDGELYVRSNQAPLYGGANVDNRDKEKMEMWYPILEKAYAALKDNGYQNIESGWSHKMMMMFTGATQNDEHFLPTAQADQIFDRLKEATAEGWPGTAVTYANSADESSRYAGSRIYASHAYSVLGVEEKDGGKFVQLRNPWGSSEPGHDGKNDGIFLLEADKFLHYFQWLNITHAEG